MTSNAKFRGIEPFVVVGVPGASAGTLPNDFTESDLIVGVGVVEACIGAEASSIEPKVTDEPGMYQPTSERYY